MDASADADVEARVAKTSNSQVAATVEPEEQLATPKGSRSSLQAVTAKHDSMMEVDQAAGSSGNDTDADNGGSEAETIVLPGKDGHSPSKIRKAKSIKHEDKTDDEKQDRSGDDGRGRTESLANNLTRKGKDGGADGPKQSERDRDNDIQAASNLGKRKRPKLNTENENRQVNGSKKSSINTSGTDDLDAAHGNSSDLSSAKSSLSLSLSKPTISASGSESSRSPSPHSNIRSKARSVDPVVPRRKRFASGSGDDGDSFSRHRSSGVEHKHSKDRLSTKIAEDNPRKRSRSVSPPPPRAHRRSISSQLPSKHTQSSGLGHKKRRVPAPLQSTDYQSDESSASGQSQSRPSRLRHLTAPTTGDTAISPAKMVGGPHKKLVNSSGQTWLARACSSGKLETVKQRYEARPEDLNEGDNAQNTPLHIASIAGLTDIVEFLLKSGCSVDPVNSQHDTPLHDAIDNNHLDVVKLLLGAGANPRKPNGKGEDPYDLVEDDTEITDEMRNLISAAKQKMNERRYPEELHLHDADSPASHSKDSPRHTPPVQFLDTREPSYGRKNASARAVKTSDSILYQPLNQSTLRDAAAINDTNTVVRILDIYNNTIDDPKTLLIAAKAGHYDTISMLFGMGNFNPDPEPLPNLPADYATPILAAIGRENLDVIKIFLDQPNFDPTRRYNGDTYFEIAKRRAGSHWKEEVTLLQEAYDKYKKSHNSPNKSRSPDMRKNARDAARDSKRVVRPEEQSSRSHKRSDSSPKAKDAESSRGQVRGNISTGPGKENDNNAKRGPGRPRKSSTNALSDQETSRSGPPKQKLQTKRSEADTATTSEPEAVKPRRKLVSGKEFRGERELEKVRRASVASTVSTSSTKERRDGDGKLDKTHKKSSLDNSRKPLNGHEHESAQEKSSRRSSPVAQRKAVSSHTHDPLLEKSASLDKEKPRSMKRDDSKDRLSVIRGESPVKRPRKSETPPRSGLSDNMDYDASGGPLKRRKLDSDTKLSAKAESRASSSPEQHGVSSKSASREKSGLKGVTEARDKDKPLRPQAKQSDPLEKSRHSNQNEEKRNLSAGDDVTSPNHSRSNPEAVTATATKEDVPAQSLKVEEEMEARKRMEAEHEVKAHQEREKLQAQEKAEADEKADQDRIARARQVRLAQEQAAREEELKHQEEEKIRRERQRQEDAEAHSREQEKQKTLYLEQEKQKREDAERRRAQQLEQQRTERIRLEEERKKEKLSKLPLVLRWLDLAIDAKTLDKAYLFRFFDGFRYDSIKQEATGQAIGREQWMLNTNVALLLGEKDLQLSRYTAWERIPLSLEAKKEIWDYDNGTYTLRNPNLYHLLIENFPEEKDKPGPNIWGPVRELFTALDLFFVKVSEFMFVVPNFPHLRTLEMVVKYRELNEAGAPDPVRKWKTDPGVDPQNKWGPREKFYVNGTFMREAGVQTSRVNTTPFPESKIPRRFGLQAVQPSDTDYFKLARDQGLYHLLPENSSDSHQQPSGSMVENAQINGITPPSSERSRSISGLSPTGPAPSIKLSNGVHSDDDAPGEDITES